MYGRRLIGRNKYIVKITLIPTIMDIRMYDTMTSIPLFLGMNAQDLHTVIEKSRMSIHVLEPDEVLALQGERCSRLTILLRGELIVETLMADEALSVDEVLSGAAVLEPESLYGIGRHWQSTYRAGTECQVMEISKDSVSRLIAGFEIFRINFINLLSTLATRRHQQMWTLPKMDNRRRLIHFLLTHTLYNVGGRKVYHTRMEDLGRYLGVTRSLVGKMLGKLQADGLLTYDRNLIEVNDMKQLYNEIYGTT